ncbi:MAG: hypothetical protein GEU79_18575 [Acidimicrobiia bacterium]|nr:hypothetical protein [Acidimicrobiia bacterium]
MFADDELHPDLVEMDALISQGFAEAEGRSAQGLVPEDAIVVTGPPGAPGRTTVAAAFCLAHSIFHDTIAVDLDPDEQRLGEVISQQTGLEIPAMLADADGRRGTGESTIVDLGTVPGSSPLLRHMGPLVAVIEGTDNGLTRALHWFNEWAGAVPLLLVNRTTEPNGIRSKIQDQIGLDPTLIIPVLDDPVPQMARLLFHLDLNAIPFRSFRYP